MIYGNSIDREIASVVGNIAISQRRAYVEGSISLEALINRQPSGLKYKLLRWADPSSPDYVKLTNAIRSGIRVTSTRVA